MTEIRLLRQEDLSLIERELKDKLKTDSITLERGYILYPINEPSCYLIVKDARQRRYKIEALTQRSEQKGEVSFYPCNVWKIHKYKKNFAFNLKGEVEIFEKLAIEYLSGRIDGNHYFDVIKSASTSMEELVVDVKQNYKRITGIGAAVVGFLCAAALYKVSEYTSIKIQDYIDFWKFTLAASWLTGLIRSSIPAISIDFDVKRRKNQMIKELTDIIKSEEPKVASR